MKPRLKRRFVIALCVLGALGILSAIMAKPTNYAATSENHSEVEPRTRQYRASVAQTIAASQRLVPTLRTYGRTWRIRSTEKTNDPSTASVHCEVPVLIFTDDLVINISAHETDAERVLINIESRSRIGRGDFGENRRHVLQLLGALDENLAQ